VREPDGLAMSSRNVYLSADERARAATLHRVLTQAAHDLKGGAATEDVIARGKAALTEAGFGPIDYIEVVDPETLRPIPRKVGDARIAIAAWLGRTRLIDNIAA
jgi:pantoate--beta-alanine ligase